MPTSTVALVTGGNSGIGKGIVKRFVAEGFDVVLVGRDLGKCEHTVQELRDGPGSATFVQADLGVEREVERLIDTVRERHGQLDVLVNNAGLGSRRVAIEPRDGPGVRWDKLRGPNLDAAYLVSAHALPLLGDSGGGAIVNISSTATLHGNWGLYGIAKAGVEALTRSFAAEAAPLGVRVNCVSPGWIETEQDAAASAAGEHGDWALPPSLLNRMGTPAEIAAAVFFLASHEASFINGQTLIVDGGLTTIDYPSRPMLEVAGHKLRSRGPAKD